MGKSQNFHFLKNIEKYWFVCLTSENEWKEPIYQKLKILSEKPSLLFFANKKSDVVHEYLKNCKN